MEETAPVQDLIAKVLTTRSCTREEFKRIYKLLCKSTHPDLTGKDGMEFIKLQEIYGKIRARELSGGQNDILDFDPHRVIRESGYQGVKAFTRIKYAQKMSSGTGTPSLSGRCSTGRASTMRSLCRYLSISIPGCSNRSVPAGPFGRDSREGGSFSRGWIGFSSFRTPGDPHRQK